MSCHSLHGSVGIREIEGGRVAKVEDRGALSHVVVVVCTERRGGPGAEPVDFRMVTESA